MATKVLAICDHGYPTGFEKVARHILGSLDESGKYDITVRGCGYTANAPLQYPYPVYPITTMEGDVYGVSQVDEWIGVHKPDLLFFVQDLWNVQQYLLRKPVELPCVAYVPVDCPNIKWSYALTVGALSRCVAYTPFGARELAVGVQNAIDAMLAGQTLKGYDPATRRAWLSLPKQRQIFHARLDRLARMQNLSAWDIVPHGLEHGKFYPIDKIEAKKAFGLPEDAFVVTYVAANQFRKRQDLAIRAWQRFKANVSGPAYLLLHSAGGPRERGWDIEQLLMLYGVSDSVVQVDRFKPELSDEELNILYNAADVNVNTSGGEGWGLPLFESAACGVPQIVPDWSVTRAMWRGSGDVVRVKDYRHETQMLNTAHAEIDVEDLVALLEFYAGRPDYRDRIGQQCKDVADRQAGWDQVGAAFDEIFQQALNEPAATPMTFDEMFAMRETPLQSALFDDFPLAA